MPRQSPFQLPAPPRSVAKTPQRLWEEAIAKVKRCVLNDDNMDFLKHLNSAAKIDLAKTMTFALEVLEEASLSDRMQNSLIASLITRIEPLNAIDPELSKKMFLAINRFTGSGMLRARLTKIAPRIGMGPKAEHT